MSIISPKSESYRQDGLSLTIMLLSFGYPSVKMSRFTEMKAGRLAWLPSPFLGQMESKKSNLIDFVLSSYNIIFDNSLMTI